MQPRNIIFLVPLYTSAIVAMSCDEIASYKLTRAQKWITYFHKAHQEAQKNIADETDTLTFFAAKKQEWIAYKKQWQQLASTAAVDNSLRVKEYEDVKALEKKALIKAAKNAPYETIKNILSQPQDPTTLHIACRMAFVVHRSEAILSLLLNCLTTESERERFLNWSCVCGNKQATCMILEKDAQNSIVNYTHFFLVDALPCKNKALLQLLKHHAPQQWQAYTAQQPDHPNTNQ